jgi:hypothetical protein
MEGRRDNGGRKGEDKRNRDRELCQKEREREEMKQGPRHM